MGSHKYLAFLSGTILAIALGLGSQAQAETLRAVMSVGLKSLDPVWHGSYVTRDYGYMVYDTLFALDADLKPKPQMVDRWSVSDDKLVYSFTLRDGLKWHDGGPVTSEDCIASIKRWGARDAAGQKMVAAIADYKVVDDKTFQLVFREPFGLVIEALAKPGIVVPFMMPKRVAETDPYKQITEYIGSGPFMLKQNEWQPGQKTVFVKNSSYKPRDAPASGLAGGKVVRVDRVEWIEMPDAQTQVNALLNGEIDIIEQVPHDLLPTLEEQKGITLVRSKFSNQFVFRPNWLHPPFNNVKIRQALMMALDQKAFIDTAGGNPEYFRTCKAYFSCDSALASTAGSEGKIEGNWQKAKQLLDDAHYDGTPVVLMQGMGRALFENLPPVAKAQLQRAGFQVKMITAEYITVMTRAIRKEPPDQGGWNALIHGWSQVDVLDPLVDPSLQANCDKARPGWPCDEKLERLRDEFARENDPAKRKKIADEVQAYAMEVVPYVPLGEWYSVAALGKGVFGWILAPAPVFWGVTKQ